MSFMLVQQKLFQFMNYHRQILPHWLWKSYQEALSHQEQEASSSLDSFVTAASEISSIDVVSDNEQFVSLRRNSVP
ncbi:hypothetical protein KIN20_006404 [Parelaphostrongylus tenuis]|uniref:Uncharacterized protein n=1 Tax=Parelaphostrongylus tenuis TaxID=148309 RepID=A0AAD5M1Q3_PARTN|nr:hypothetical protein KIN20_006404 [Parelaphostrongylus tenuis]